MKKFITFLILLILPVFFIILSNFYTNVYSPYYLNYHHDPSYVYLLNSLNLATGHFAGHVEHPGTPLHVFGAVAIKLFHIFYGNNDITTDVLTQPEEYLRAINFSVLLLNSFILFLLGLSIYRIYKNYFASVFMQLCPFFSISVFMQFSDVNSESFIAIPVMLLLIFSFRYININPSDGNSDLKYIVIFSVIIGLGICTKIILFPLILIPLLLFKKISQKLLLLFLSGISFLVFFIPAIVEYRYFFKWIGLLFFKSGLYGGGEEGILILSKFLSNIETIILSEKLFALISFVSFIFIVIIFLKLRRSRYKGEKIFINSDKYFRLLTGLFLSITIGTLIIAKHYVSRYMMPYLMLIIPVVFLIVFIQYKAGSLKFKSAKINVSSVFIILIILTIALNFRNYLFTYQDELTEKNNAMVIHDKLKNEYSDAILISGHLEINQSIALHFGTSFTGRMNVIYKKQLSELYPDQIIFNALYDKIYKLSRDTDIKDMLSSEKRKIFLSDKHNSPESLISKIIMDYGLSLESFDLLYEDPYDFNEVKIYEIKFKK